MKILTRKDFPRIGKSETALAKFKDRLAALDREQVAIRAKLEKIVAPQNPEALADALRAGKPVSFAPTDCAKEEVELARISRERAVVAIAIGKEEAELAAALAEAEAKVEAALPAEMKAIRIEEVRALWHFAQITTERTKLAHELDKAGWKSAAGTMSLGRLLPQLGDLLHRDSAISLLLGDLKPELQALGLD